MNDSELRQKLAAWQIPPASETTRSRAEWHALTAFRHRASAPPAPVTNRRVVWRFAALAAGLTTVIGAFFTLPREAKSPAMEHSAPLLAELEDFFQGRLAAVIQQDGEIDLQLSEAPAPRPPDQRVAVRLEWPGETIEILTYSGIAVCVDLPSGTLCLTPLITGSGSVLLLGDHGLIENLPNLRTEAHTLHDI